ncbi:MAG: protein-disulfide reductase DsbD domain-containing protein [Bacteroidia bacterium]
MKINLNKHLLFVLFFALIFNVANAQFTDPVHCSFIVDQKNATTATLNIKCKIDDKWHIFALAHKGEIGLPTVITIEKSDDFEFDGELTEPKPLEELDAITKTTLKYFSKEVTFGQKIKIVNTKPFKIKGILTYQSCNDDGCLAPNDVDFILELNKDSK